MAPLNFWKRQLPLPLPLPDTDIPLSDILDLPSRPTPTPSTPPSPSTVPTNTAVVPSAATSLASSRNPVASTPAPSASNVLPSRPSQSVVDEDEEVVESTSTIPSATPTTEGILVRPAPTPEPLSGSPSSSQSLVTSTVGGIRTVVVGGPSASAPAQVGAAKGNDFLDNKALSGSVFGLCGLLGLVIIGFIIWVATRKARQTKKLEQEVISWDPDHVRGFSNGNANAPHASNDADTRSIDELEEKGRSLDSHFNTYTLPSQNMHAHPVPNHAAPGAYADYYGAQRPIQVTLPPGDNQPYRANW